MPICALVNESWPVPEPTLAVVVMVPTVRIPAPLPPLISARAIGVPAIEASACTVSVLVPRFRVDPSPTKASVSRLAVAVEVSRLMSAIPAPDPLSVLALAWAVASSAKRSILPECSVTRSPI